MAEKTGFQTIYKWMWHKSLECVVEVKSRGHFPTTVMVRLPDDRDIETDIDQLTEPKEL